MMNGLSYEEVLIFHEKLINASGGIHGVRDGGLIKSALGRAFVIFDSMDLYPDLLDKIVATTYALVSNHGFVDGNKRIGLVMMIFLIKNNGLSINYSVDEFIQLGLNLAAGNCSESELKIWIKEHLK